MGKRKFKHTFKEFISGDFITRRRLDRYIWFAIYLFWLVCGFIAWNLCVENKLIKIAENNRTIKTMTDHRDQTALDLLELDRKDVVQSLLEENNSKLKAPVDPPAAVIKSGE